MPQTRFTIGTAEDGRRLDVVVAAHLDISRSKAADLLAEGAVMVGGRSEAKSYRVEEGDTVEIAWEPETGPPGPLPPFDVVAEDEDLLVVVKPAGVVVHPAPGLDEPTLTDAIAASGRPLAQRGGADRPGVVHRLDRDVSGLLMIAKTDAAHERLSAMLKARDVTRIYLAGVAGAPEVDSGKIDAPVGRHPRHRSRMTVLRDGKHAVTWFRVLERFGEEAALCEVRLETGRTHQIRTHLESIGHPVLGDPAYGHDPVLARSIGLDRPFLHAHRLSFVHPATGEECSFTSPLPDELEAAARSLRERARQSSRWTPRR